MAHKISILLLNLWSVSMFGLNLFWSPPSLKKNVQLFGFRINHAEGWQRAWTLLQMFVWTSSGETLCVNSCVFWSGCGKTYTMLGTDKEPGIYVRTLNDLFRAIEETSDNMLYSVSMSYLEARLQKKTPVLTLVLHLFAIIFVLVWYRSLTSHFLPCPHRMSNIFVCKCFRSGCVKHLFKSGFGSVTSFRSARGARMPFQSWKGSTSSFNHELIVKDA